MNKEGGKIVGDTACPKCRENGRDSTGNHLIIFEDGGTYCNRCEYTGGTKDAEERRESDKTQQVQRGVLVSAGGEGTTIQRIRTLPHSPDVSRCISLETSTYFGVRYGFDESTGLHDSTYYPITHEGNCVAYKQRVLPKGFFIKSDRKMKGVPVEFFGQSQCNKAGKKLLITGGEEDAMAAYEMLLDRYPKFKPAVVSVTHGENLSCVADNKEFLDNFKEILVCTDMDEAGRKVAEQICKQIGERCKLVLFDEKDASDMKVKGKANEFVNAYFNAKDYTPADIIKPISILDDVVGEVEYGIDYPWESLTAISYGLFTKQIISIGASVGSGKTTFMHQLTSHLIYNVGQKVALYSLEETPVQTMKKLISFVSGLRVDLPGTKVDVSEIRGYVDIAEKYLLLYDAQGYLEWESIKGSIRYMASVGTKFFVIDPLTALTSSLSASRANELLNEMMGDLAKLVQSLDITVFLVSHLNNSQGKAHSEGGRVTMDQFTSSRAVVRWSHLSLGLERDQQAEDEEDKNTMTVRVLKNRVAGTLGTFQLKYSPDTGRLSEVDYEF